MDLLFSFVSNLTLSESFFAFFLLDDFFLLTNLSVVGACVFAGFFVGATVGSTVGSVSVLLRAFAYPENDGIYILTFSLSAIFVLTFSFLFRFLSVSYDRANLCRIIS